MAPEGGRNRLKVMVAVDGSPPSARAVDMAGRLIQGRDGAQVILIHCVSGMSGDLFVGLDAVYRFMEESERLGRSILDAAARRLPEPRPPVLQLLHRGDPGREIVAVAREQRPDLLVVGRRGLGRLQAALLGSVSSYVIEHWDGPVLVVQ
ncbi:universal stress protein [Thermaerobacter sp. PB12/4term]|nr:universal stress protein [Thermaerobacter sp. PB12/4term]